MRELLGDIIDSGYADIARKISDIWSYPECPAYLNKLIIQDRLDRKGFPFKVVSALMELQELRGSTYTVDVWGKGK